MEELRPEDLEGLIDPMDELSDWLAAELRDRGWSMRELGRRAGVSHTQVSDVISTKARRSADFCLSVAHALNEQPESVLRRAGLLPSLPPAVDEEREVVGILRQLPATVRRTVVTMLRSLAGHEPDLASSSVVELGEPQEADDTLIPELLAEFRKVPDEWKEVAIAEIQRVRRFSELPAVRIIGEEEGELERGAEEP
jgi:transcriptional regulator with XRE-family HTH domain